MAKQSLLEELLHSQRQEGRCSLRKILKALSAGDRSDLVAALKDDRIYATTIQAVLKERGYDISDSSIRRCRKSCDCGALDGEAC